MHRKAKTGFTLIELLIVVAIIAILAAIAIPNFLEAQVRSKVSRCKTDIRTIAVGWEAYRVDWNCYPRDQDNDIRHATQYGLKQVTTPVAYLTSIPVDPFFTNWGLAPGDDRFCPYYEIASEQVTVTGFDCFCIQGLGPDRDDDFSGNDNWPNGGNVGPYDPTNGTVSNGDIYRFGGNYRDGQWNVWGLPYQQWGSIGN